MPFKDTKEGQTHWMCSNRFFNKGTTCCSCDPHDDCNKNDPVTNVPDKNECCEKHVWDLEEFNPHCHICGVLMRDDEVTLTNQPIEEKWKAEFDKKFLFKSTSYGDPAVEYVNQANIIQDTTELKSFIENLLEQEKKRMSDEIEKMKKTRFIGDTKSPTEDTEWISRNQALDEVLSIINK